LVTTQLDPLIHHLRQFARSHEPAAKTDGQLLESFVARRDESAFAALVRRHGPMVLGVCRRVLRNYHDAEDAFQATFLVLARKARSVRPAERVANFLHGVAYRTALKVKSMTAKKQARERQVIELPEIEAPRNDYWRDLRPVLDQELNGLPDKYRLPIILCDLEDKSIKEATRQLGWPQGTLAGRLARGRKMLVQRLARRGVTLSAGSLAAVLSANVTCAGVPAALASSTVKAASLVTAGQAAVAGVVGVEVAALMKGVMKAMMIARLKTVTAAALAVAAVGVGGALLCGAGFQPAGNEAGWKPAPRVVQIAGKRPSDAATERQASPATAGSLSFGLGVNSNAGLTGSVVLNERNFDTGVNADANSTKSAQYKALFIKTLTIMAEHFEHITSANQYDGRIEARAVNAAGSSIIRIATASLSCDADGKYSVAVRINIVKSAGDKADVVGRDARLEQLIVTKLNSRPAESSPLKGAWRVVSVTGGQGAYDTFKQTDLVFIGQRLLVVPNGSEDTGPASVYLFHLGARRPVREIDFFQKADPEGTRLLGAYDVKGDELRLCLSARVGTRSVTLEPSKAQVLLVARRIKE
jgi:RNA polymerase sigma factor (sigma-70 family)